MPSNSNRMNKINEELKKVIGSVINNQLKNPRLTGLISVTKVQTTPDLRYARVYISMFNEKSKKETLSILKRSAGFVRSEVARKVNLRMTPELVFLLDDSMEYGSRIEEILSKITKDMKKDEE